MAKSAKNRDKNHFSSLSRLDHNRFVSFIARKLNISSDLVRKCLIWGNHSHSMHPDLRFVEFKSDNSVHSNFEKVITAIQDQKWLDETLPWLIKDRAFEVIRHRQKSSAPSSGSASVDHMRDWINGTRDVSYSFNLNIF